SSNFIDDNDDPYDCVGHGTHVAAIVVGDLRGNCPGFVGYYGNEAILKAVDGGMDVINMSFGKYDNNKNIMVTLIDDLVRYKGTIFVESIGNEGVSAYQHQPIKRKRDNAFLRIPTKDVALKDSTNQFGFSEASDLIKRYDNTNFVKNNESDDDLTRFNIFGGVNNSTYKILSGASMSSPYIAGVAALYTEFYEQLKTALMNYTPREERNKLLASVLRQGAAPSVNGYNKTFIRNYYQLENYTRQYDSVNSSSVDVSVTFMLPKDLPKDKSCWLPKLTVPYAGLADDATTRFHAIIDGRSHPENTLLCNEMKAWQGPAILFFNNAKFETTDFESLMKIRVGGKQGDNTKIGKHGLGFNSCYHFTDVPSFISGDSIAFLDPLEKFLPRRQGDTQRGIICPFSTNGIAGSTDKDQLAPYIGIEGINFQTTFEGTLFRIPLRKQPSDISDIIYTTEQILALFTQLKSTISSQCLFLRNIETIEISYKVPYQTTSICKAIISGSSERRNVTYNAFQPFQIEIELIDSINIQKEYWVIVTGAQHYPNLLRLQTYAERYRLRVFGGIAALRKSSKDSEDDFIGRMYSFFPLPDTTGLPFHLNGTWAQGSDHARLLIENDMMPDLDHQKLDWNRHILLNFLPNLYCNLIKKIVELTEPGERIHPVSKFWLFPSIHRNYPKYAIEYGFKVLELLLQNDEILISDNNESDRVKILFEHLSYMQIINLRNLLRNNWNELRVRYNQPLKSMIRSLPIWSMLSNPTSSILLDASYKGFRRILTELDVPTRDIYVYTFEDVELPREYDNEYFEFLKDILKESRIVRDLGNKRWFPNSNTKILKKITELYDYDNLVFRTVFGRDFNGFLHPEFSSYKEILSTIGFKNKINQEIFKMCANKVKGLQRDQEPPSDIRYRGFILVDHLYKNINALNLEGIEGIPFIPITKKVAWSQMPLIAEDVIPPQNVLDKYPSFGKLDISTADAFKNNINEVYKFLDEECRSNEDFDLSEHIHNDRLFLNFNRNQNPFQHENWVTSSDLVLNSEFGDVKYVNSFLAKYPTMLKCAGAREIRRPNVRINVREPDQSHINKNTLYEFLLDPSTSLHDVTFVINGENIKATDSMRILLRYLYGQNIDEAIQKLNDNDNFHKDTKLSLYKDLLKLASDYNLDYLKELMELRLSRLVIMSNVDEMKRFAEISSASQLIEYCNQFIRDNSEL
ncbi:1713_t:CDS:10, partial [Funneliformis caledonium]